MTTTYSTSSNAARAARQACVAAGVTKPLAGVHFKVEPADGDAYAFVLIDQQTGETTRSFDATDPGAALDDDFDEAGAAHEASAAIEQIDAELNASDEGVETTNDSAFVEQVDIAALPAPPAAPKAPRARKPKAAAAEKAPKADSKRTQVLGMLARPEGATGEEVATAMGWLPHTTRAFISTVPKKEGLSLTKEKVEGRGLVYRASKAAG